MLVKYLRNSGRMSEKNEKVIRQIILPFGLLDFALGITLSRFFDGYKYIDFISGFLMGLSIVMITVGIIITLQDRNKICK